MVRAPSQDKEITLYRKKMWEEENEEKSASYKPNVNINVKGKVGIGLDKIRYLH